MDIQPRALLIHCAICPSSNAPRITFRQSRSTTSRKWISNLFAISLCCLRCGSSQDPANTVHDCSNRPSRFNLSSMKLLTNAPKCPTGHVHCTSPQGSRRASRGPDLLAAGLSRAAQKAARGASGFVERAPELVEPLIVSVAKCSRQHLCVLQPPPCSGRWLRKHV